MKDDGQDITFWRLALAALPGISVAEAERILAVTGSEKAFFDLLPDELARRFECVSPLFADDVRRKAVARAREEMDFIGRHAIRVLWFNDRASGYPPLLELCPDAPVALFALGNTVLQPDTAVLAVVGTRHATQYGTSEAASLVKGLAERLAAMPVIVSGLAYGIDIAAHTAALDCGVPTVAVLAHGLNTLYPAAHRRHAARIVAQGGMLLTEYFSSQPVHKGNFLARNRIVAGMSQATAVIESDVRGGALATARMADGYGREVFALPGRNTDRYSAGCNRLIARGGARLLLDAESLAREMRWALKPEASDKAPTLFDDISDSERQVIDFLTLRGNASLDELREHTALPMSALITLLTDMEFKRLLKALPAARYEL